MRAAPDIAHVLQVSGHLNILNRRIGYHYLAWDGAGLWACFFPLIYLVRQSEGVP